VDQSRHGWLRLSARVAVGLMLLLPLAGCHALPRAPDAATVTGQLQQRFGTISPTHTEPFLVTLPPGACLEDGLTEDEAIAIALWNNAQFQELLTELGMARGDLIQAGLLPNPEFIYFFHVPGKPFKYAFELPIEALWLRPIRVKNAQHEAERTAERLTQSGLDLIRDVRQAYADAVLAKERLRVADEAIKLRGQIARFAEKRLQAGDISPLEAATAKIDALLADQDRARIRYDTGVAEERLRHLLGIGILRQPFELDPCVPPEWLQFDSGALTLHALSSRPDALAAAAAVAAAQARLTFATLGWVRVLGIGDATSGRRTGHEFGPALRFTVPFFNWNQGGVARAEAELDRAVRNQQTIANQIILDVQRSYLLYQQAAAEYEVLRTQVRPEVQTAIQRAEKAYQEGNVTYLIVLETTRQLLDNELRAAQLHGELRRTWAELERSVGRRLSRIPDAPVGHAHPTECRVGTAHRDDPPPAEETHTP
jgi:cobalt-zinc-cadmium efflux system outer membrane protein